MASPPPGVRRSSSVTGTQKSRFLEANGCGFTVPSGDGEALANRILELAGDRNLCATLGARARFAFEREWDKEQGLAKWEDLLRSTR